MCTINQNQEQQEKLQTSVEENNNSNSTFEIKEIDNTPFKAVHNEEGWFGVMGNHRITPNQNSYQEMINYITDNKWEVILSMVIIVTEKVKLWKEKE